MKRLSRLILLLVIVSGWSLLILWLSSRGMPGGMRGTFERVAGIAEAWIAEHFRSVANRHLGPELQFDSLVYQYPNQATATNVRLVADGESIIEVATLRITMTEMPRRGQPVIIEALEFERPVVRLLHREDGSVIGFDDSFVKSNDAPDDPGPEPLDEGGGEGDKLSDYFAIRRLIINDGSYEQRASDGRMMVLDQLELELHSHPDSADPGRYDVDAVLERAPIIDGKWDGYFDLDELELGFDGTTLNITLDEERYKHLPATLQEWLNQYQIVGKLGLTLSGVCPASSIRDSELSLEVELRDASAVLGEYNLPVRELRIVSQMDDRVLYVPLFDFKGPGDGRVDIAGQLGLEGDYPADATVDIDDMRLERFVPSMAGLVQADGHVTLDVRNPGDTMSGTGRLEISEGRLVRIPVIDGLLTVMKVGELLSPDPKPTDTLTADLLLHGHRLDFDDIDLVCRSVAAHGEGELYFDNTIDFRFNGGPLEKVQRSVPIVGDIARAVSDRVVTYRATGPADAPVFKVLPLGIGSGEGARSPRTDRE